MAKILLPYGNVRNSDIVVKNGAHMGGGPIKARSRVVGGKTVVAVRRKPA
jgi:hypothetical protein